MRVATMRDRESVSKVNHYCLIIMIQWNLYKWGSMGRAKLELAPFLGYNLYYEVLIYYLIASLFGVLIN